MSARKRQMIAFKLLAAPLIAASFLFGQTPAEPPRITGIAHNAYYVSNLTKRAPTMKAFSALKKPLA
ncbi:MAG: hypothetical protein ACRD2G_16585 [Terriglobia bacterium]